MRDPQESGRGCEVWLEALTENDLEDKSDLAEPAYSTCCLSIPFVHEVKLLYVRYDALMNATDIWEDMNMMCR